MKIWKNVSKISCEDKHVDLLLVGEGSKRIYALIRYFNTFIYDYTLHHGRKHFCRYCLHALSTEEILKYHIKDCFKISGKQRIIIPKKGEYVRFTYFERKMESSFLIYVDFERILVLEDNGKQIRKSLIRTNIKNILLAVMTIN